jgi:hypothetical protein
VNTQLHTANAVAAPCGEEDGQEEHEQHRILGKALPRCETAAHAAFHGIAKATAIRHAGHVLGLLHPVHADGEGHGVAGSLAVVAPGGESGEPAEEKRKDEQGYRGQLHATTEQQRETEHDLPQTGQRGQGERVRFQSGQAEGALGEILFQLVGEAQRIVGLDEAADNEQGTDEDP